VKFAKLQGLQNFCAALCICVWSLMSEYCGLLMLQFWRFSNSWSWRSSSHHEWTNRLWYWWEWLPHAFTQCSKNAQKERYVLSLRCLDRCLRKVVIDFTFFTIICSIKTPIMLLTCCLEVHVSEIFFLCLLLVDENLFVLWGIFKVPYSVYAGWVLKASLCWSKTLM